VNGREEVKRERRAGRLLGMLSKDVERGTRRLGVAGGVLEQLRVEGRSARALHLTALGSQAVSDLTGVGPGWRVPLGL